MLYVLASWLSDYFTLSVVLNWNFWQTRAELQLTIIFIINQSSKHFCDWSLAYKMIKSNMMPESCQIMKTIKNKSHDPTVLYDIIKPRLCFHCFEWETAGITYCVFNWLIDYQISRWFMFLLIDWSINCRSGQEKKFALNAVFLGFNGYFSDIVQMQKNIPDRFINNENNTYQTS